MLSQWGRELALSACYVPGNFLGALHTQMISLNPYQSCDGDYQTKGLLVLLHLGSRDAEW